MPEERMSEQESLVLIQQMIQSARDDHNENGKGWRLWGWILFIASLGSFLLIEFEIKGTYWLWNIVFPIGIVILVIMSTRRKKSRPAQTYAQDLLDRMGLGFFGSLLAMILGVNMHFLTGSSNIDFWGFFYILYGFWMYIHGSALKFKPLLAGAVLTWIAGILMFGVPEMKYKMLIGAIAVLLGYIVPGYLLYFQSKQRKT